MSRKICFPFIGDSLGGSHISSLLLISELKNQNYKTRIVLHQKGKLSNFLDNKKIKYDLLKIKKFPSKGPYFFKVLIFMITNFFTIRNFLKKEKIEIIHGNDLKVNLIWSFSSIQMSKFIWHQRNIIKKNSLLQVLILIFSSHIIVISETVLNCFIKFLKSKSSIIYNPVEKVKISKNLTSKKFFSIAFIGKDKKEKGFDIFIQITNHFKKNCNIKFNAYGFKKKILEKNYNFISNEFTNINKILSKNDLLIAPSRREGFGRSLIEFAMAEKKILASNIEAHKEIKQKFAKIILLKNKAEYFIKKINENKISQAKITQNNITKLSPKLHTNNVIKIYKKLN
tara:strand:- start:11985 stop:13007 length:1023 start_codon:yes stop_codon:yes gene_type:complete